MAIYIICLFSLAFNRDWSAVTSKTSLTCLSCDFFLFQQAAAAAAAQSEMHNRQASADSGVGGMGSQYNLGPIPEDDMMDTDLDTTLTADNTPAASGQQAPAVTQLQAAPGQQAPATEQLISSLPAEMLGQDSELMLNEILSDDTRQPQWI